MGFTGTTILRKNKYLLFIGTRHMDFVIGDQNLADIIKVFTRRFVKNVGKEYLRITADSFTWIAGVEKFLLTMDKDFETSCVLVDLVDGDDQEEYVIQTDLYDEFAFVLHNKSNNPNPVLRMSMTNLSDPIGYISLATPNDSEYEVTQASNQDHPWYMPIAIVDGDLAIKEIAGDTAQMASIPDVTISKKIECNFNILDLVRYSTNTLYDDVHEEVQSGELHVMPKFLMIVEVSDDLHWNSPIYLIDIESDYLTATKVDKLVQSNEISKSSFSITKELNISSNALTIV